MKSQPDRLKQKGVSLAVSLTNFPLFLEDSNKKLSMPWKVWSQVTRRSLLRDTKQGFVSSETKVITTLGRLAAAAQEE